ncbi:DUF4280 domain-containing protein [Paenibacillus sp. FSL H8-0317]|uniref:DUF4280 domain-containing protein n=1 Tax=unclassified Paenibacillus TaxID=185978 RepID=UPI0030D21592
MAQKQELDTQIQSAGDAPKSYVVAGAILKCNCGTQRTRLKIPFSHGVYIKGKAQMTVEDYIPGIHIGSFGNCSNPLNPAVETSTMVDIYGVKKAPCMPVLTMSWLHGKGDTEVEGKAALLSQCTHKCLYGGDIVIEDDGQQLDF